MQAWDGRTPEERDALARSELLGRLTHEVASPLGVISGALQELRGSVPQTAETERYFRLAERALERLVRLSRELDEAADLEAPGEQELALEREPADLRRIVETAIGRVRVLEPRVSEILETRLPATPIHAEVDVAKMTRVVDLLLAATLRFGRTRVRLEIEETERGTELHFDDDGAPIPEAFRDRLFDRFRARFPGGRDRGVVFGLSIARDYVVAHGGRIAIEKPAPPLEQDGVRLCIILPPNDSSRSRCDRAQTSGGAGEAYPNSCR